MTCVWAFSSEQKALTPSREGTGLGHARGAGGFSVSGRPETPKWLLFNHAWMYTPHVTLPCHRVYDFPSANHLWECPCNYVKKNISNLIKPCHSHIFILFMTKIIQRHGFHPSHSQIGFSTCYFYRIKIRLKETIIRLNKSNTHFDLGRTDGNRSES